jgi:serine/threonine-protein kinase HipA
MKIGDEYRFRDIHARQWRKMAQEVRLDPNKLIQRVNEFAAQLADHAADIGRRMREEGIDHPLIPRLVESLAARADACRRFWLN